MNQTWNAHQYGSHAAFVSEYGVPVLELLSPQPGEQILDLGCGEGALAAEIAARGADVLGVDASPAMIDATRQRGISAQLMSGDTLTFRNRFDAVFSNAALHWMTNADAVLQGVNRALKPGARFVGEFGGQGNVGRIITAIQEVFDKHPEFGHFHNPWYFPSVDEYRNKLGNNGFEVDQIQLIPRPTPLKSGLAEWLKIFCESTINQLDETQVELFLEEVETLARPYLLVKECWEADYVRLRFAARKSP